jgi:hypothetical protein
VNKDVQTADGTSLPKTLDEYLALDCSAPEEAGGVGQGSDEDLGLGRGIVRWRRIGG